MSIGDIISVAGGSLKSLMSGDLLIGAFKVFEKAAGKVANSAKSVLSGLLDTGAKTAGKIGSIIEEKTGIDVDGIVAPIGDACEWLGDKVFEPGLELLKKTGASVINAGAGLVKGIAEFGESILDSAITSKANSLTSYTALFDVTNLVINKLEGNDSTGETLTQKLLQGTMSFVAEDYVGTVHSRFYEETMLGQLLDEKAFEPAKSDGGITNFASEVGYQAPLFVISFLTGGTAAASAAGLAGFGRYTEESWANSRDSSWEGIKRMYEKGKITAEQFQSFTMIRSLNDSEWAEIENDYQKGLISQEEFETMQQIREMPEEWRTAENFEKGMLYGLANGTWEGIQWYVGGKIAGMKFASSPIGNAAIKVGIDSGFNALDTPFRTTTTAATSDKTWEEAWEEQGGWQSVLINLGVGLLGSSLGEIIDYKIANKNKTNIDTNSTDINTETIKNTIDPEHGFQLSADDMGDFYKANIKNGFFTNEQIENMLNQINSN